MNVLLLDCHPDEGRFASHLLDLYRMALPGGYTTTSIALRDLTFDPVLRHGYRKRTEWEPDLTRLAERVDACDHLVIAFPMWWGSEPAELKGLLDRVMLPGFTFAYHDDDPWWDRLMEGRSADVIATMDTPPFFLRFAYGNALIKRWKGQVLGFMGFNPVRILACGPIKQGGVEKNYAKWQRKVEKLARSIAPKSPGKKKARLESFLARGK